MFTAMVLACAIGSVDASTCIEATDERGPYQTREECVMRVHQMISALAATMPVPMQYSYKCELPKEGVSL
jgi:hypothetical protein